MFLVVSCLIYLCQIRVAGGELLAYLSGSVGVCPPLLVQFYQVSQSLRVGGCHGFMATSVSFISLVSDKLSSIDAGLQLWSTAIMDSFILQCLLTFMPHSVLTFPGI